MGWKSGKDRRESVGENDFMRRNAGCWGNIRVVDVNSDYTNGGWSVKWGRYVNYRSGVQASQPCGELAIVVVTGDRTNNPLQRQMSK